MRLCVATSTFVECMGLPITTTTIVDEWLNNLIFPDNNKCITVNGRAIIYVAWQWFNSQKEFWKAPINSNIHIWLKECQIRWKQHTHMASLKWCTIMTNRMTWCIREVFNFILWIWELQQNQLVCFSINSIILKVAQAGQAKAQVNITKTSCVNENNMWITCILKVRDSLYKTIASRLSLVVQHTQSKKQYSTGKVVWPWPYW